MLSATVRDIAIIIIAIQTIVISVLLGILIWQIWRFVRMMQLELKPIVDDAQETLNTVRGTANFVSDTVVNPVVKTSSNVVRYRRTLQALTTELRLLRRPSPPSPATSSPPKS